ncbi:hypothetical protein FJ250_00085 [bacterium]|nr:hypothetical protein [bacterium]
MTIPPSRPQSSLSGEAWRSLAAPVIVLTALAAAAQLLASCREQWQPWLGGLGAWTPVLYQAMWLLLVPAGLPAAALGLAGGFVFGFAAGSGWAAIGLAGSGLLMHRLGRRWFRRRVERVVAGRSRLVQLQAAAAGGGAWWHVAARLSPLNYALVSYTLAAGGAPLRPYAWGLAGALPGLLVYVWLGAAAAAGTAATDGAARGVLIAAGVCGLVGLGCWLARALRRGRR